MFNHIRQQKYNLSLEVEEKKIIKIIVMVSSYDMNVQVNEGYEMVINVAKPNWLGKALTGIWAELLVLVISHWHLQNVWSL